MGIDAAFAERVLGSLSSGIVGIDPTGALVVINEGARAILGCPVGELDAALGRDCREVLAGPPALAQLLLETLERGSPLSRAELVLSRRPDGSAPTIGFTLSAVRDGSGRVCGSVVLFRDLEPIERGDEQARLRDRLAALGQMAAGLAHEIRNPLAGIEVLAGLLRRRLADRPEELSLLSEIRHELGSVADAVGNCLEFVRPVAPTRERVDPRALLDEALLQSLARVPFSGRVECRLDGPLPELCADEEQLRVLLGNLVVNALEAMGERGDAGCLTLAARALDARTGGAAELEIAIADNGPGVPPELREKVFYPFFTTRDGGSGVGLALAQKIALSHGGSVELESPPGCGCTFRLRLPAGDPRAAGSGRHSPVALGEAR